MTNFSFEFIHGIFTEDASISTSSIPLCKKVKNDQKLKSKGGPALKFSTANQPQTDGLTERFHQTIEQILRSVVHHRQTNWEDMLPMCEFAYNDMVQASTCEASFFMNHGLHTISNS